MKYKIWVRIFFQVSAIIVAFVVILTLADKAFLTGYFLYDEKRLILSAAKTLEQVDWSNWEDAADQISILEEQQSLSIQISDAGGNLLYDTWYANFSDDISVLDRSGPKIRQEKYRPLDYDYREDGSVFITAVSDFSKTQYLLYNWQMGSGYLGEIQVQKDIIQTSANTAGKFIFLIAIPCLILALFWVLYFARRFARPITQMNDTAKYMAELHFDRKLEITSKDEIGQLAVSINELSDNLDRTLADLRQKNSQLVGEIQMERKIDQMRKEFIANVSHELKTPLSIIQGYVEGLKLGVAEDPQVYCDVILEESARMNELVLSLLELARYESGQAEIHKDKFDIAETIHVFCQKLDKQAEERGVTLQRELPEHLFTVADSTRIYQVLQNYMSNAFSHVNPGGVITIRVRSNDTLVQVEVENTGSGIPEDSIPKLWQSFYRGDPSHKREADRFGLGLSIVRSIMQLHGREYGAFNTPTGVCFWFTLDLYREAD